MVIHSRHSTIHFDKNTVTKTTTPDLMRVEVEKTRRAFEIGRNCGLFRVPKVLEHDEVTGTAVFERLHVKPVSSTVGWGEQRENLAKCLGTSLALIHKELVLPIDMRIPLPKEFVLPFDEVFIHGDLSVDNVYVSDHWPPIVILDWQMTPLYGGQATYGTRYFDILWFINNLINRPYTRFLFTNPAAPVAKVFMESYFHEAPILYDSERFAKYAILFFNVEMPRIRQEVIQNSKGRARLLLPYCQNILKEFIESLKMLEPNKLISSYPDTNYVSKEITAGDYRKSHLQPGKAQAYHATFSEDPYRNMVWQFEKDILDRILKEFYGNSEINHFDFACGTGRILSHLQDRTKSAVGVDLAPKMLEIARKNTKNAEIIEADLTQDDTLEDRRFNLITAFRFFPNAQPKLRSEAMQVLANHLEDKGYLVFNNHKNTGSTRNRLARFFGRRNFRGMSIAEVKSLLAENHLEIIKIYPLCVFPASGKKELLPMFLLRQIEKILTHIPVLCKFGENLVFVCKRGKFIDTTSFNRDKR